MAKLKIQIGYMINITPSHNSDKRIKNEVHHGKIVEYAVRKKGFNITALSRYFGVNRRSIYNWFSQEQLKPEIIYLIGTALRHDFSNEFPELFSSADFKIMEDSHCSLTERVKQVSNSTDELWKDHYITLLENNNTLLKYAISRKQSKR
jgi:lambda repressor-like predicted transcriptional regulator